jgi:hypothetical protein
MPVSGTAPDAAARSLGRVLHLSNRMLAAAQSGAWGEVTRMQRERDLVLHDLFADPLRIPHEAAGILGTVLDLNREIAVRVRAARDACAGDLRRAREHRRADRAYGTAGAAAGACPVAVPHA